MVKELEASPAQWLHFFYGSPISICAAILRDPEKTGPGQIAGGPGSCILQNGTGNILRWGRDLLIKGTLLNLVYHILGLFTPSWAYPCLFSTPSVSSPLRQWHWNGCSLSIIACFHHLWLCWSWWLPITRLFNALAMEVYPSVLSILWHEINFCHCHRYLLCYDICCVVHPAIPQHCSIHILCPFGMVHWFIGLSKKKQNRPLGPWLWILFEYDTSLPLLDILHILG